ncbi:MAG: hypothetical protein R2991_04285 [Thermoanaerobaculia bacterium]
MALSVFSEVGRLRRALVHRPEEIDLMVPEMMDFLLFDDILTVIGRARSTTPSARFSRAQGSRPSRRRTSSPKCSRTTRCAAG